MLTPVSYAECELAVQEWLSGLGNVSVLMHCALALVEAVSAVPQYLPDPSSPGHYLSVTRERTKPEMKLVLDQVRALIPGIKLLFLFFF